MSDTPSPSPSPSSAQSVQKILDPERLKRDLAFSQLDISNAMAEQASLFAYYGTLHTQAQRQTAKFEMMLDLMDSKLSRHLRRVKTAAGEKFTEASIKSEVTLDPRIVDLRRAVSLAESVENLAKNAVEAFRHRRDMLIQLALISREEMKGDVSVSRRREAEHARKDFERSVLLRNQEGVE